MKTRLNEYNNAVMKKDNLIFAHKFLKAIADSIIKVFIPLFILKSSGDLNLSMIYLVVYSCSVILTQWIFSKLIEKYGVICIMVHFVPIIVTMGIFSFGEVNLTTVLITAVLMSLSQSLYSVPLNIAFAFGDKKTNVGKFQIASNIGKLVFTLISGLILSSEIKDSFLILSISSSIVYLVSVIPLFFIYKLLAENYARCEKKPNQNIKVDKWFIIFHIAFGIFQPIMDNLVPLYLYVNSLSFKAVTYMIVSVELIKIVMNYLSQFGVKRGNSIVLVSVGAAMFMTSITMMLILKSPVLLYVFSCLASVSFPLTFVPMFRLYSKEVRDTDNVFSGMLNRDYQIFSGRPIMYALSFLGAGLLPSMLMGVAAVPIMLISELKLLKKDALQAVDK